MFKSKRISGTTIAIGLMIVLLMSVWFINSNFRVNGEDKKEEVAGITEIKKDGLTIVCDKEAEDQELCDSIPKITENVGNRIVIFYQDKKQEMTKQALSYTNTINYPVERNVYSESGSKEYLEGLETHYQKSGGHSEKFGYFPIIFIKDKAFSGFDQSIKKDIEEIRDENYKTAEELLTAETKK